MRHEPETLGSLTPRTFLKGPLDLCEGNPSYHAYERYHKEPRRCVPDVWDELGWVPQQRNRDVARSTLPSRPASRYREVVTVGSPLARLQRHCPERVDREPNAGPEDHIVIGLDESGHGATLDPGHGSSALDPTCGAIERRSTARAPVPTPSGAVQRPGGPRSCRPAHSAALRKPKRRRVGPVAPRPERRHPPATARRHSDTHDPARRVGLLRRSRGRSTGPLVLDRPRACRVGSIRETDRLLLRLSRRRPRPWLDEPSTARGRLEE